MHFDFKKVLQKKLLHVTNHPKQLCINALSVTFCNIFWAFFRFCYTSDENSHPRLTFVNISENAVFC